MKRILVLGLVALLAVTLATVAAGCGGEEETTTTAPTETTGGADTTAGDGADGAALFASNCAACHGADGTGGAGPDLTAATSLTEDAVVEVVTSGRGSMPGYGDKLSGDEIEAVAGYVVGEIVAQ